MTVVWQSYDSRRASRLFGDQVQLQTMFEKLDYNQIDDIDLLKDNGAVIVIPLYYTENYINELNIDISRLDWCIIICTANEFGSKAYQQIKHPNKKIWLQTPRHDDVADRYLGFGSPSNIEIINEKEIENDWIFLGQVNHKRRKDCIAKLMNLANGRVLQTAGFGQGYSNDEYLRLMYNTKIIPCPGGPETPDTFRVYEALELGCIPVIDMHAGNYFYQGDYWKKVLGDHPLKTIDNWAQSTKIVRNELENYESRRIEISKWYTLYKQSIEDNLIKDVKELISNS